MLSPGQRPTKRGLIYAATPASDFVCGTQQVASGITVQVFTTGRGTPYGLMAVPVIKMATRTELANRWFDLMDINAGTIATGEETIEEVGWKLFHFILDVASGKKKTFSDQWGCITSWQCLTRTGDLISFGTSLAKHGLSAMFLLFKAPRPLIHAFALP